MDNGIALIAIVIAAVIVATVAWFVFRRNLPPEIVAEISALYNEIRSQLSGVVDEATIRTLAGAVYDVWGSGSKYISRDDFIALIMRAWTNEKTVAPMVRNVAVRTAKQDPNRPHVQMR
jgi:Flp pilus assembly pilin Flp